MLFIGINGIVKGGGMKIKCECIIKIPKYKKKENPPQPINPHQFNWGFQLGYNKAIRKIIKLNKGRLFEI